jgi:tetratricopeptide (TPR) repeat protein
MKKIMLILLTFAQALIAMGCASRPAGAKIVEDVKTIKEERAPEKLFAQGRAFAAVADLTRAEQYLAAAIDAGADEQQVLPLLLRVCIEAKHYRVALTYAEPPLRHHPDDHRLRFVVASLYATIGDLANARSELERVVQAAPEEPEARYALAVLLRDQLGDPVGSDAHFRSYLRLAPEGRHAEEARACLLKVVE